MGFHLLFARGQTWFEMAHGRLAVDFFFLLSGFVICRAYEAKLLKGMSRGRFAIIRAIRLGPMLWLGLSLSVLVMLARSFGHGAGIVSGSLIPSLGFALLNLPDLSSPPARYFAILPPRWSLFYEMAINMIYAGVLRWLTTAVLIIIMVGSVVGLAMLDPRWSLHDPGVLVSCGRLSLSFAAGVLIGRLYVANRLVRIRLPVGVIVAALVLMLAAPIGSAIEDVFSIVSVCVAMPLILIASCFTRLTWRSAKIANWLGEISYPLYLLHLPLYILILPAFLRLGLPREAAPWLAMPIIALVSGLAGTLIDVPIRERLSKLLLHRQPRHGLQSAP
ncbi:acyltransferase [Sphingomonas sp. BIUV-7]|uniref:Acyltransferase n=1 Tax=Sphingomonas natans TaxID=3063330 RepID=A0ABT8YBI2_9SPHN|nr:acyltransferase [Sphingomonas sp. BIUV-7]MDO6415691.1 acyltransferase [Sphingomonas sp. BIUV-7]